MNQQPEQHQHAPPRCGTVDAPSAAPFGYDDLRRTLAWGDLGRRSVLTARGPDAVRFIDNFTTAAISALEVGAGTEAFFTDARGWVLSLATMLRIEDGVWIDAPAAVATSLREHLEHYHIRERVELTDESDRYRHLVIAGPQAAGWLAAQCGVQPPEGLLHHGQTLLGELPVAIVRVDWFGPAGFLVRTEAAHQPRLAAWLQAQGLVRMAADALDTARIEAGVPEQVDIPEKTLPQELGRDQRAISFTKGCYLGQETVARIDALGHVNRRFVAVAIDGRRNHAAGAAVRSGDDVVGRLTSVCFSPALGCSLGLGLVQTKAIAPDKPLEVERDVARVVTVPVEVTAVSPASGASLRQQTQADTAWAGDVQQETGELLLEARRFRVVRVAEAGAEGRLRHREVIRHPGSVVIVPLVSPREVCLVEVVRVAVGRTLLELPAGTLDRVESLEEAARRELAEETGFRAGRIVPAGAMWMSPGILRERMHLFVAEDLIPGPQALEPGEQIRIRVVAWDEALAMCLDGRIDDAKTIAGLLLTAARRRQVGGEG
jgi:folate-binding protein YgfZ